MIERTKINLEATQKGHQTNAPLHSQHHTKCKFAYRTRPLTQPPVAWFSNILHAPKHFTVPPISCVGANFDSPSNVRHKVLQKGG